MTDSRYPLFDQPAPTVAFLDPSLPEEEKPRLSPQHQAIADALRSGPKTNLELNMIAHRYGARLHELKAAGFLWTKRTLKAGVYEYRMIRDFLPDAS